MKCVMLCSDKHSRLDSHCGARRVRLWSFGWPKGGGGDQLSRPSRRTHFLVSNSWNSSSLSFEARAISTWLSLSLNTVYIIVISYFVRKLSVLLLYSSHMVFANAECVCQIGPACWSLRTDPKHQWPEVQAAIRGAARRGEAREARR